MIDTETFPGATKDTLAAVPSMDFSDDPSPVRGKGLAFGASPTPLVSLDGTRLEFSTPVTGAPTRGFHSK